MDVRTEPINSIVVSDEELLFITTLMSRSHPSTDGIDTTGMSDREVLGVVYGERSLRARGLAQLNESGRTLVDLALLTMVEVGMNAEQSLWLTHTPTGGATTLAQGYLLEDGVVLRTQPGPGLHRLDVLASPRALIARMLDLAGCGRASAPDAEPITLDGAVLGQIRTRAVEGDRDGAVTALSERGVDPESAVRLVATIAESRSFSVFSHLAPRVSRAIPHRRLSVLRGIDSTWLMVNAGDEVASYDSCVLMPADAALAGELLDHWLIEGAQPNVTEQGERDAA